MRDLFECSERAGWTVKLLIMSCDIMYNLNIDFEGLKGDIVHILFSSAGGKF